jgi:hypothetical protein
LVNDVDDYLSNICAKVFSAQWLKTACNVASGAVTAILKGFFTACKPLINAAKAAMNAVIDVVKKGLNSFFTLHKLELYGAIGGAKNKIGASIDIEIFGIRSSVWTAEIDLNNIAGALWAKCKSLYAALGNIPALLEAEWNKIKNVVGDAVNSAVNKMTNVANALAEAAAAAAKAVADAAKAAAAEAARLAEAAAAEAARLAKAAADEAARLAKATADAAAKVAADAAKATADAAASVGKALCFGWCRHRRNRGNVVWGSGAGAEHSLQRSLEGGDGRQLLTRRSDSSSRERAILAMGDAVHRDRRSGAYNPIDRTVLATLRLHWYNATFAVLDRDSNGFLTGVDAGDELHRMGFDHVDKLQMFDADDDGKFNLQEFTALYKAGEEIIERNEALARSRRAVETLDYAPAPVMTTDATEWVLMLNDDEK